MSSLAVALCLSLLGGRGAAPLPASPVVITWQHTAEPVVREETWDLAADGLRKTLARIKTPDRSLIAIPADARLENGWYVQHPTDSPVQQLVLPASDHVASATLCSGKRCKPLRSWLTASGQGKNALAPKAKPGEPARRSTLLPAVLYPCSRQ